MERTDRVLGTWAYADLPTEAAWVEARERAARSRGAPRRYEVTTATTTVTVTATRAAAVRRARLVARRRGVEMFVTDRRARVCAVAVVRFRADGTIAETIVRAAAWPRESQQ